MLLNSTSFWYHNTDILKPFTITLTRDSEEAKDLFQETLYRAIANKDKYNVGTNIKAWLYTIMRNIFINNYRRRAKQKTIFDSSPNNYLLNNSQSAVITPAMRKAICVSGISGAIHGLPEIFRNPFLLSTDINTTKLRICCRSRWVPSKAGFTLPGQYEID